jgi:hypothetical protein
MGAKRMPTPPACDANAAAPVTATTTPCQTDCWKEDYTKEVSVNSCGRYSETYQADGSRHDYSFPRKWKLYAPVKTGTSITIEFRLKAEPQTGVTAADVTDAKSKLENGVATHWDNHYTLTVCDPVCGRKTFSLRVRVVWVDSGEHYTIKIHTTYPREGVTGLVMDVSRTTSPWTYAHEMGHCLGLPDEYSYTTNTETVKYYKPDLTQDVGISAPYNGKPASDPTATIMSTCNNTVRLPRHGWFAALEVEQLLYDKLGRGVGCAVS